MAGKEKRHQIKRQSSAYTIYEDKELTPDQKNTMWRIMLRTYEIAALEAHWETKDSEDDYRAKKDLWRPQNSFYIDGARGAGKTTMLMTLNWHMRMLGVGGVPDAKKKIDEYSKNTEDAIKKLTKNASIEFYSNPERSQYAKNIIPGLQNLTPEALIYRSHDLGGQIKRRTVCVLPVLFPSDLEKSQTIMEGVFGQMRVRLEERIDRHKEHIESWQKQRETAQKLLEELNETVTKGWYLARHEGDEAILRDSFDFDDYLKKTR